MIRLLAVLGLLLLALPVQLRAQGADPIAEYRAALSQAETELNESFALARTRGLLQNAFNDADIEFSQRYLDRWSATVFQRWARMRLIFGASDMRLANWQAAVGAGEVSAAEAEAALADPMAALLELAGRIPFWLSDDVERLTERAFWTDLAQSVGCCDTAYYQALEEADQAAASSQSPSAATIAGLELLPPVGMPDFDPAARAYAGLALRAEALALEGGDTPAARREILNDAALLAELFGDRPAAGLIDLAVREGFGAAPVAPLIALARITEPGPLRDTLIAQARLRLEARAAYFDGPEPATSSAAPSAAAAAQPPGNTSPIPQGMAGGAGIRSGSGGAGSLADAGTGAAASPGVVQLQMQLMVPELAANEESIVASALAALRDDSQSGLAAAATAARAVDEMLLPGDIAAALAR